MVALFSGAIGSLATCREVKGVATSIPGVAIAVALMPPLCVVGYGLGVAVSLDGGAGWRIAQGGGLLFLTNLVAITFMAMLVFLAIHVDTATVRGDMQDWRLKDPESVWLQRRIDAVPAFRRLQAMGTLPGRLLAIGAIILLILIPLTKSFGELKREILRKQDENLVRKTVQSVWTTYFSKMPDGTPRSYLGNVSVDDSDGKIALVLNVFTSRPYTENEKAEYQRMLSLKLDRPEDSIVLQLLEVPTATSELLRPRQSVPAAEEIPTVAQLQSRLLGGVRAAMRGLVLPPPAQLVTYSVTTSSDLPLTVSLVYVADRDISEDAKSLLVDGIHERLGVSDAAVRFEWVKGGTGPLDFGRNRSAVTKAVAESLDEIGRSLTQYPQLTCEIVVGAAANERDDVVAERAAAVTAYLDDSWKVPPNRITVAPADDAVRTTSVRLAVGVTAPPPAS